MPARSPSTATPSSAWVCDPVEQAASTLAGRYGARWSANPQDAHRRRERGRRPDRLRHPDPRRPHPPLRPRRQEDPVREADRPRHGARSTGSGRTSRARAVRDARLQPSLRPHLPRGPLAGRGRRDRPGPRAAHHQPRPAAAARRLPRRLGRHVPRHDHPRLRHGPLPAGRDRRGVRDGLDQRPRDVRGGEGPRAGDDHPARERRAPCARSSTAAAAPTATTSASRRSATSARSRPAT